LAFDLPLIHGFIHHELQASFLESGMDFKGDLSGENQLPVPLQKVTYANYLIVKLLVSANLPCFT
jgi:hypothetical protein